MPTKKCSMCGELKDHSKFYKDKRNKDGLYSCCKKCHLNFLANGLGYFKKYRKTSKWREYLKKYKATPEWKEKIRKYNRERNQNNGGLRLTRSMRCLIWLSLKDKKAGRRWESLVNYTIEDLIKHLENQFSKNMNWNNYGSYWEIDHIKPVSLFNFNCPEDLEFKECWSLNNLQPLEKSANKKKYNFFK